MPESAIVSVFASLSVSMVIPISGTPSAFAAPSAVSIAYRRFSRASEALETSSRTKTSLSV